MNFIQEILEGYNYWVVIVIMMIGFYIVINSDNLVKKLMGLAVFQTSVLLFYISTGNVKDARFPILRSDELLNVSAADFVNPLPHVLMLTAIVVGVATLAVGLAIVVRIKEEYGTIEEEEILELDDGANKK